MSRPYGHLTPSRSKSPPSTESPRNDVRIDRSGHAPPPFEPADAPFHGVARRVPFRVMRLGVRAPAPDRDDSLQTPLREPSAESVAVIGPIRDQTGQGRAVQVFTQTRAWARAARHAQAQGAVDPSGYGSGC